MTPSVSVIIPCYNAAPWLKAAFESALSQSCPKVEVIAVNDGSSDDTLSVARGYEARGVRVLNQRNLGAASARNTGLRAARGEFIQFLDADDLLAPDKIERQMSVLAANTSDVIASGEWGRFHNDPARTDFDTQPNWRDLSGVEFLQLHYETGCMMHPAAWLAPRRVLDRAGPWNESLTLNDDGEYFSRVMLAARGIRFTRGARSYYRSNLQGSLSGRKDARSLESLYRSVELTLAHLLAADRSPRTRAAAAAAWWRTAFELYPGSPALSRRAEARAATFGPSRLPLPGSGRFQLAARLIGWRLAKRFFA
jgi:glycosyltransferase involved in cell wall biosynthesis